MDVSQLKQNGAHIFFTTDHIREEATFYVMEFVYRSDADTMVNSTS